MRRYRHSGGQRKQRGAIALVLMALVAMGGAWATVATLNAASTNRIAVEREHNARVMQQAREALVAWVARQALETGESNPGRLPCPEPASATADADADNDGVAASYCATQPAVGRLPWRTLGLPKLLDAAGEPLWYVVGSGWANTSNISTLVINPDSQGQLTVDGQANAAVALLVAPGRPLVVQSSTNCTARSQVRSTTAALDLRDHLECQNATSPADATFATTGPSDSFNDQVLRVTTADIMPLLEAAIAKRIENEIVPVFKAAYASAEWGTSTSDAVLPFAAPFANPGTSNFHGTSGTLQGLMPFSYSKDAPTVSCTYDATTNPRCVPSHITWGTPSISKVSGSGALYGAPSCVTAGTTYGYCADYYSGGSVTVELADPATGFAYALRTVNTNVSYGAIHEAVIYAYDYNTGAWTYPTSTVSRRFNSDGTVSFVSRTTLPSTSGWGYYYVIGYRPVFLDHSLLDTATSSSTGWFARNGWHKFVYYALASSHAATGSAPRNCQDASGNCLTVTNVTGSNKRALLILSGRSLSNAARPNATLSDYVDNAANRDGNTSFTQDAVGRSANDRLIVVDKSS